MKIATLQIVHIYEYKKESGKRSPVDLFIKDINPIKLSTCMRQIYLFDKHDDVNLDTLHVLVDDIKHAPMSRQCKFDHFKGAAAYSFILYWLMGGRYQSQKPFQ